MDFFDRYKPIIIVVVALVLLIIAFVTAGYGMRPNILDRTAGAVLVPAQRTITGFVGRISSFPDRLRNPDELLEENEQLRAQLSAALAENTRLRQAAIEAEGVRELVNIRSRYPDHPTVGAQVVSAVSNNWFDAFTIDRGTNDGIERNMPVLAPGGLVGRVVFSANNHSRIVSFLNVSEDAAVSVRTIRTGEAGVVRGDINLMRYGLARMDYIDLNAQITIGDELVTSHLSNIFPPGISVGTVQEVRMDASGLFQYAVVAPSVDFGNIPMVLVITEVFGAHLQDEGFN